MTVTAKARASARAIRRTPEAVAKAAGGAVARELNQLAKAELGSDQRMSGLERVKVAAKVTVTTWGRGAIADVEPSTPRARAPWRWLTDGTKAHQVPRNLRRFQGDAGRRILRDGRIIDRDQRGATRGKRARMKVGDGWRTGPWQVSGVQGRDLWWRARLSRDIRQAALDAFYEEMRRG